MRSFEDKVAVREMTPLLVGLAGASGSGKTYSALRLATGIQRISGGDVFYIDTEARRSLHYADEFKFRHIDFKAPFSPQDYLEAIQFCAGKGAGIIIVDSMSHEHEGVGGVLEMHASEEARMRSAAAKFAAWQKPKEQRRKLINAILQMPINFIFCFRAKEKIKPAKKKSGDAAPEGQEGGMISMGWMPIAGEEFIYEMTVHCLLPPGSGGVPVWNPEYPGEKAMVKLPRQFEKVFSKSQPLSEDIGEVLAEWASGGKSLPEGWHSEQAQKAIASHPDNCSRCVQPYKNDQPCNCRECTQEMRFRASGKSQSGTPYDAFWACPNKCKDSKDKRRNTNIDAQVWHERFCSSKPTRAQELESAQMERAVPPAQEAAASQADPAPTAEWEPTDYDPFTAQMNSLMVNNPKVFWQVMGERGYKSFETVPKDKRLGILMEIEGRLG